MFLGDLAYGSRIAPNASFNTNKTGPASFKCKGYVLGADHQRDACVLHPHVSAGIKWSGNIENFTSSVHL